MTDSTTGETLRMRRVAAGMSQRALALKAQVPQPNIAAYESGRRVPSPATLERLTGVLSTPTLERLRAAREQIIRAATDRRLSDVRVFGSVARERAGTDSDVDLLVHPAPEASLFDLSGFMAEIEELLGIAIDVVSDRGTGPIMDRIRAEAIIL